MNVFNQITDKKSKGQKQLAVLIDPDKISNTDVEKLSRNAADCNVDFIFVGGSLLTNGNLANCIRRIKYACNIPVVLFPGNNNQIDEQADAILFLSLISGRNPDLLIGKQVTSAPLIREKNLEAISTGYMLIESGNTTTALYISNTVPIPADKPDIASCTAMAGEMLGLKMIFMDAGSGAKNPVSESMIREVRKAVQVPLIVGGGIKTPEKAIANCKAGADIIVIGTSIEKDASMLAEFSTAIKSAIITNYE